MTRRERKGKKKERTHHAAMKTNDLNSPTHSFSISLCLTASSASVHTRGWQRSAQELEMSELTQPYLKIARFCKQLIFSMGRNQGAVARASLGRCDSGERREGGGDTHKGCGNECKETVVVVVLTPSQVRGRAFRAESGCGERSVCVECKHWQTQTARRKIHQHGKLLRFPHTASSPRERARVVRNQHDVRLSYIFKCWERRPDGLSNQSTWV